MLEVDIVRAADKMQDNLIEKVDRYYDYGVVKRGTTSFSPTLTFEERTLFSFDNFNGDEINVLLSIIGLLDEDFSHKLLRQICHDWGIPKNQGVIDRILELAQEVGESQEHLEEIKQLIVWYRNAFQCRIGRLYKSQINNTSCQNQLVLQTELEFLQIPLFLQIHSEVMESFHFESLAYPQQ